tara:strand:+ start:564 stop:890 length:327 start_codon:yes stop_codon:yes gene_type:complete
MKEIKWIKGNEVKPYRPYDYPEGYSKYFQTLIDDLSCYKTLGKWEEKKTKIPKELHRRRWIVGVATFEGEKGLIDIRFSDGEFMPLRTHNWIMKNDRNVKKTIQNCRG